MKHADRESSPQIDTPVVGTLVSKAVAGICRWLLAGLCLLIGCAPLRQQDGDLSGIQREHFRVYDVRACEGMRICWPWLAPHRLTVYRDADGKLYPPIVEQASEAGDLSELENPVGSAIKHLNYGPNF